MKYFCETLGIVHKVNDVKVCTDNVNCKFYVKRWEHVILYSNSLLDRMLKSNINKMAKPQFTPWMHSTKTRKEIHFSNFFVASESSACHVIYLWMAVSSPWISSETLWRGWRFWGQEVSVEDNTSSQDVNTMYLQYS